MTADIYDLPEGWTWARFQDIADVVSDLVDPADYPDSPHIAPNHIESFTGRLLPYATIAGDGVKSPKHRFHPGQILYSKIRPYLCKAVPVHFNGLCSADMYPVSSKIDTAYLHRWLISPRFTEWASNHDGRTLLPKINQEALSTIPVPVPPLAEQRRIVTKVEALLARVNAAWEHLGKLPAILKRFRQAVLAAACSGEMTKEWREEKTKEQGWKVVHLGEVGSVSGGITKNARRPSFPQQVPYLRVANVYENRLELAQVLKIGVNAEEFERTVLKRGDLLFVEGNGSIDQIGRVAIWDGSIPGCVHQNHLIRFRASELVLPEYALLWMMAPQGREQLIEQAISSAGLHSLSISKGICLARPTLSRFRLADR
jgi:type I restriction enzyme, S subunit